MGTVKSATDAEGRTSSAGPPAHACHLCVFVLLSLAGAPAVPHPKKIDTSDLPKRLLGELDMELEAGHFSNFSPELSASDFESIRRVLACELELSERESYMVGSSHLAARLFVACEKDEAKTLALLVLLESKLRPYAASGSSSPLRNDVLLLNDLLQAHPAGAELVSHFSSPDLSFDLVDLGDVIATWFAGCFAALFPPEFALRAVDLVLLSKDAEGAQACVAGLMLGVLLVSAMQLLGCPNSESLFGALHDLPLNITKAQMNEAFAYAYWCYEVPRAKGTLALTRKQADWAKLIAQAPGTIKFSGASNTTGGTAAAASTTTSSAASSRSTSTSNSAFSSAATSPAGQYRGITVGAGKQPGAGSPAVNPARASGGGFSLTDFHQEAASARHSIAMKEGANLMPNNNAANGSSSNASTNKLTQSGTSSGAAASPASAHASAGPAAAASPHTPPKASNSLAASSAASAVPIHAAPSSTPRSPPHSPRHAPNTSAAGHLDPQLVTELAAATAQGVRVTSGNTQQLLERALREIRRLEAKAAAGGAAGDVDPAAAARALAGTVSAIAPTSAMATASTASSLQKFRQTPVGGVIRYSDLLEYQGFPCLCMQGYLNKSRAPSKLFQRKGSTGFFGNLHRRFFVLQGSFLTYFKVSDACRHASQQGCDESESMPVRFR